MIWWHLLQLMHTEALTATPCLRLQSHQIEQLKEEIGAKDLALVKEHFDHMKVLAPAEAVCYAQPKGASNQLPHFLYLPDPPSCSSCSCPGHRKSLAGNWVAAFPVRADQAVV